MLTTLSFTKTTIIILIDIAFENYTTQSLILQISEKLILLECGFCRSSVLKLHGKYSKYYYQDLISILRYRCSNCLKTHALIPSFSLPGRSIGTEEAEIFLQKVHLQNESVYNAGKGIFPYWLQTNYIYNVNKKFETYILKAKAIFPNAGDHSLNGFSWIKSVIKKEDRLIFRFNQYCLDNQVNCVFCTRNSFLWLTNNKAIFGVSHKIEATLITLSKLNSS